MLIYTKQYFCKLYVKRYKVIHFICKFDFLRLHFCFTEFRKCFFFLISSTSILPFHTLLMSIYAYTNIRFQNYTHNPHATLFVSSLNIHKANPIQLLVEILDTVGKHVQICTCLPSCVWTTSHILQILSRLAFCRKSSKSFKPIADTGFNADSQTNPNTRHTHSIVCFVEWCSNRTRGKRLSSFYFPFIWFSYILCVIGKTVQTHHHRISNRPNASELKYMKLMLTTTITCLP